MLLPCTEDDDSNAAYDNGDDMDVAVVALVVFGGGTSWCWQWQWCCDLCSSYRGHPVAVAAVAASSVVHVASVRF